MATQPARDDRALFDLTGRVAVVTGGTSGIGKEIALALGGSGARVAVAGRDATRGEGAVGELGDAGVEARFVAADVGDPDQATALVEDTAGVWGGVDILVNCAGVGGGRPSLEVTPEDWRRTVDIDLTGPFFASQAMARDCIRRGRGGAIVNVTSISGLLGYAGEAAYGAAKGGLTMLTRVLAVEWATHGIRVNALAPTWFYTPMAKGVLDDPGLLAEKLRSIPLGRPGQVQDAHGAALFLASEASAFVTGQVLCVDGGKFALLGEW